MEECTNYYMYSPVKWGTIFWALLFRLGQSITWENLRYILELLPCNKCRDNALHIHSQFISNTIPMITSYDLIHNFEIRVTTKIHSKKNCTSPIIGLQILPGKLYTKMNRYIKLSKDLERYLPKLLNTLVCKLNKYKSLSTQEKENILRGATILCDLLEAYNFDFEILRKKISFITNDKE